MWHQLASDEELFFLGHSDSGWNSQMVSYVCGSFHPALMAGFCGTGSVAAKSEFAS